MNNRNFYEQVYAHVSGAAPIAAPIQSNHGTCQFCKSRQAINAAPDPFAFDVYNDNTLMWFWCAEDECEQKAEQSMQQSALDI